MKAGHSGLLPLPGMRIAIIIPAFGEGLEHKASQILVADWIIGLAKQHPTIQWAVVGPGAIGNASETPNLNHLLLDNRPTGLASRWWHRRKLHKSITSWAAKAVINLDPEESAPAALAQVLVLHPDWTLQAGDFYAGRPGKRRIKKLTEVQRVVVPLAWQQEWLQKQYGISPEKIALCGAGTTLHFGQASWAQRENWKQELASGQEYFLYAAAAQADAAMVTLLKGFSAFKKRQRSSMRLVLAITSGSLSADMRQKLDTYKYRDDLVVVYPNDLGRLADLAAGSYAVLAHETFAKGWWLRGAMQSGVPVIAAHLPAAIDLLGEAGMYVEAWKADLLAEAMMLLYKDEAERRQLTAQGLAIAAQTDSTAWVASWLAALPSK